MPWTLANTAHNKNGVTALTVPATTIGNLLFLAIVCDHTASSNPRAPTGGGTWGQVGTTQNDATNNEDAEMWRAVCTSSVTTINIAASMAGDAVCFAEFTPPSGTVATDVNDTTKAFFNSTTTTDATTSNNITPAGGSELIVAAIQDASANVPTFTQGTGWSLAVAEPGTAATTGGNAIEYKTGPSGSQNATWTINKTNDRVTVQIAAFLPADVAAGGGPPFRPMNMKLMGTPVQRMLAFPAPDMTDLTPVATALPWGPIVVDTAVSQAANN